MKGRKRVQITLNQRYDTDIIILLSYLNCPIVELVDRVIEAYRNDNWDGCASSIPLSNTPQPVGRVVNFFIPEDYVVPGNYKAAEWIKLLVRTYARLPKPYLLMEPWIDEKSFGEARSEKSGGLSAADRVVVPQRATDPVVNPVITQTDTVKASSPAIEKEPEVKRRKPLTSAIEEKELNKTIATPDVNEPPQIKKEDLYDSGEVSDEEILNDLDENESTYLDALAG